MNRESIIALTSLPPAQGSESDVRNCIRSWLDAGLKVKAFNHPKEIVELSHLFDVDFVPVTETTAPVFGKHYIPIKVMLDWAARQNVPVLLINSDIHLKMSDWEIKRVRWLSNDGLCYFVRYNYDGDTARASQEGFGIDAFLFHGRNANELSDSFLSMGQPFWDYWLPYSFAARNLPIASVDFPAAFHRRHQNRWSWQNWHRCAIEFARITGELESDCSFSACIEMSLRVRQNFDFRKFSLAQHPVQIKEWVQQRFNSPGAKTFLELGSHKGTDTKWMAEIPDVTVHAFEPDPRNYQEPRCNVVIHRKAIAERDGLGVLIPSLYGWGQEWTHSSSIKQPKNHLHRFPVTFGEPIEVQWITLDTFCDQHGIGVIDFIWADVQGAEGEMIRGGQHALARTHYLYTEYSDEEMYENQATLREIVELLPDFRVIELWPDDVLLENKKFRK